MDIDGVLNLLGRPPTHAGLDLGPVARLDTGLPWSEDEMLSGPTGPTRAEANRRRAEGTRHYPIQLDGNNNARLTHLTTRDVSIEWATTWNELAPTVFAPHLGHGGDWPVVRVQYMPMAGKYPSLVEHLEVADVAGHRILWIDDDPGRPATHRSRIRNDPLAASMMEDDRFVLLRPRPNRGLADVWDDVVDTLDHWDA